MTRGCGLLFVERPAKNSASKGSKDYRKDCLQHKTELCQGIPLLPDQNPASRLGVFHRSFQGGDIQPHPSPILTPHPTGPRPFLTSCRANRAWACQLKSTPRVNWTHISLACERAGMGSKGKSREEKETQRRQTLSVSLHESSLLFFLPGA